MTKPAKDAKDAKVSKKKSKRPKEVSLPLDQSPAQQSKPVQLDSLQSIFAPTDKKDGVFTLFGGDPVADPVPASEVKRSQPQPIVSQPQQPQKTLYFFPHYDSPEKNALSLFPVSTEPFFHRRTEYFHDRDLL
jgi:hypothetical protein